MTVNPDPRIVAPADALAEKSKNQNKRFIQHMLISERGEIVIYF